MIDFGQIWLDFSRISPLMASLAQWALHASLIVLLAVALDRWAGSRRAKIRRRIWSGSMIALALLAAQTATSFPVEFSLAIPENQREVAQRTDRSSPVASETVAPTREVPRSVSPLQAVVPMASSEQSANDPFVPSNLEVSESTAAASGNLPHGNSWPSIVLSIYLAGLVVCVLRLAMALMRLHTYWSRSDRLTDEQIELARLCASQLSLARVPHLGSSSNINTAMTWIFLRPVILVPPSFGTWSKSEQRHCLLHEMAHVAHRDGVWNWIMQVVSAAYWFHPLVHFAKARLRRVCEEVADDAVIESGAEPTAYSRSLLLIARHVMRCDRCIAGSMGAATSIETRIRRVLEPSTRWSSQPRWMAWLAMAVLVALACTTIRPQSVIAKAPVTQAPVIEAADQQPSPNPVNNAAEPAASTDDQELFAETLYNRFEQVKLEPRHSVEDAIAPDMVVQGIVQDDRGPIAGAIVLASEPGPSEPGNGMVSNRRIVARATTDDRGFYQFDRLRSPFPNVQYGQSWVLLVADRENRFSFTVTSRPRKIVTRPETYKVQSDIFIVSSQTVAGRVVTTSGQPLEDAMVIVASTRRVGLGLPANDPFSLQGSAQTGSPEDPFGPQHRVRLDAPIQPMMLTNTDGQFNWKGPPKESVELIIRRPGYYPRKVTMESSKPVTIELREMVQIAVSVVDEQSNPISDHYNLRFRGPPGVDVNMRLRNDVSWKTTAEFLRDSARDGRIELQISFPAESGLLDFSQVVAVEELITSRRLDLRAESGVRVSGKVLSSSDRSGLKDVQVVWHSDGDHIKHQRYSATTNESGLWETVLPRQSGFLSVVGVSPGHDLVTVERFNENGGLSQRFTTVYRPNGQEPMVIQTFVIERTKTRLVEVVDANGVPVANVKVSAEHLETVKQDGKVYRFEQQLAESEDTDANGKCELTLNRAQWEQGMLYAQLIEFDDSGNNLKFMHGRSSIEPNSPSPLTIVLKDPWRVIGRVQVDGRPASNFKVGLTKRFRDSKWFGKICGYEAQVNADGSFEILAPADDQYSVVLWGPLPQEPDQYYFLQKPVTKVAANQYRAENLDIRSNQLKTRDEFLAEWKKLNSQQP